MNLYAYLILTVICLSPSTAECPDSCFCAKYRIVTSVVLHVYCGNVLNHVPRDHISSDVTTLDLTSNQINTLVDAEENSKNIIQLKVLVLAKNNMTRIESNSLKGFTSLVYLDLSYNNISSISNDVFKSTPNLKRLHLSNNPNLVLPENGFGTKELERIHIGNCNLKEIPSKFFDTMPNIKNLHLEGNHITDLAPNHINYFKNMEFVNLEYNNISVFHNQILCLLNSTNVVIGLNGNPLPCNCQFKEAYDVYSTAHIMADTMFWYTESKHELSCEIPAAADKRHGVDDQTEFLSQLNCDNFEHLEDCDSLQEPSLIEANETLSNSDYSLANSTMYYNNSEESTNGNSTVDDDNAELYHRKGGFQSYTVIWIVVGVTLLTIFIVTLVFVVIKRRNSSNYPGMSHQFGLLQSEQNGDDV